MLLKTRFYLPPLRPNTVRRDSLLACLKRSGGGSLILVAAPAGYGKTTLISQWLHFHPHHFAWLTLGEEHNVPSVFWQYVVSALQQVLPEVGSGAESLFQTGVDPDYRSLIVSLLNDLDRFSINNSSNEPVTLVLDDFHLVHNASVLGPFNLFLDHLPPCIRVVITARSEPELQLPRRRASGQLLEIGVAQLRFDAEESRAFFSRTMGLADADVVSDPLWQRTEGWVAGLQLAALSLQRHPAERYSLPESDGLDRHIADYLLEEVFVGLPLEQQQFLLQTSIVKRFCAGLANALSGRRDGMDMLTQLESANLFLLALDNHRTWFRYHDLFRQFLLQRFSALSAAEVNACVQQAIDWLEQNGHYDDAIELCLEQGCWQQAVRLLTQDEVLATRNDARFRDWLQRIPTSVSAANATLQKLLSEDDKQVAGEEGQAVLKDMIEPLTQQEKTVLSLIANGLSNKAIAAELHISLNTLKVHIRNLYGKMGVENRTQALLRVKG